MAALSLELDSSLYNLVVDTLKTESVIAESEKELLRTDLSGRELKIKNLYILQKFLASSRNLSGEEISIESYLTKCKVKFQSTIELSAQSSTSVTNRRQYLATQQEKREYNRMVFGTEK